MWVSESVERPNKLHNVIDLADVLDQARYSIMQRQTNGEAVQALRRLIKKKRRHALLSTSLFERGFQERVQSRSDLLLTELDMFLALAPEGNEELTRRLCQHMEWGLNHLADPKEWPVTFTQQRLTRLAPGPGSPGQCRQETQVKLAELPPPGTAWEPSWSSRVANMSAVDLVVRARGAWRGPAF